MLHGGAYRYTHITPGCSRKPAGRQLEEHRDTKPARDAVWEEEHMLNQQLKSGWKLAHVRACCWCPPTADGWSLPAGQTHSGSSSAPAPPEGKHTHTHAQLMMRCMSTLPLTTQQKQTKTQTSTRLRPNWKLMKKKKWDCRSEEVWDTTTTIHHDSTA